MRCPRCGSRDQTEELEDGRWWADCCNIVFTPRQPPRLLDPPPSAEERRKDLA